MDIDSIVALLDVVYRTRTPLVREATLTALRRVVRYGRGEAEEIVPVLEALDRLERAPDDRDILLEVLTKITSIYYQQFPSFSTVYASVHEWGTWSARRPTAAGGNDARPPARKLVQE